LGVSEIVMIASFIGYIILEYVSHWTERKAWLWERHDLLNRIQGRPTTHAVSFARAEKAPPAAQDVSLPYVPQDASPGDRFVSARSASRILTGGE
jgi:hypothetical protein